MIINKDITYLDTTNFPVLIKNKVIDQHRMYVYLIQRGLTHSGYNPGFIDGILGTRTFDALYQCMTSLNLQPTPDVVDRNAWQAISCLPFASVVFNSKIWNTDHPNKLSLKLPAKNNPIELQLYEFVNTHSKDLNALSVAIDVDPKIIAAIASVESGPYKAIDPTTNFPPIRFEVHKFWDYWGQNNKEIFNKYFSFDQNKRWTNHRYKGQLVHTTQLRELEVLRAAGVFDLIAAYNATSVGMFQILGINAQMCGFISSFAMHAYMVFPMFQFAALGEFILSSVSLYKAINKSFASPDWLAFARHYNGPGQAEFYANLLKTRFLKIQEMEIS